MNPTQPRTIAITGASGMIGSALAAHLQAQGHRPIALVRRPPQAPDEVFWSPDTGEIDSAALEGVDAVVHLAGQSIAARRWDQAFRRRILESRVEGTRLLSTTLGALEQPPDALICASATGYYGDRADETLDEHDTPGDLFLSKVCQEWEAAAQPAVAQGIRTIALRIGVVLSPQGGALATMLPAFRLGLGGPAGSGRQWAAWIVLDDLVRATEHLLFHSAIQGPVNATAPHPVRNAELARALGHALRRPAFLPLPGFAARLLLGQMADETLLASTRALPRRLLQDGFVFRHPYLGPALESMLEI